MASDQPLGVRAGFWRRWFACLIDLITIWVPFQLIVPVLFVVTSGHIQMTSPLNKTVCSAIETVPDGLVPPPPAGLNLARECNAYFFGAQTARVLQVGPATKEGTTTNIDWLTYGLDRDGRPIISGVGEWIMILALIAYLVATETRTGATLGKYAMGIRVIDAAAPAGPTVPLRKIALRYLVMLIGFVWIFFAPSYSRFDESVSSRLYDFVFSAGVLVLLAWITFVNVQIARKRDPLYDRMAGTAVVRAANSTTARMA
jgi:uncharacterized RDD family membrane protein YckC